MAKQMTSVRLSSVAIGQLKILAGIANASQSEIMQQALNDMFVRLLPEAWAVLAGLADDEIEQMIVELQSR